ncbi:hypothetical protein Q4E93_10885 [Flavitalea sp. BT771]|uniref:hypothetical protein n=1 Tax=Flavitalea sp. BT771 TaxID=3063329 RepID=UPI0026E466D9|nr:hypothetical protein [Flavitalea sp. BT771]MDO6431096.1 hypothetical protein [Flavitalea sp. BT771]MDV6220003.1 hypothetical protein [Flavitalea sp. BT771]
MKVLHDLLHFIKGTIHYRIFHKGLRDFSRRAIVVPINTYRFTALPGRRRNGMKKAKADGKVVSLHQTLQSASSH